MKNQGSSSNPLKGFYEILSSFPLSMLGPTLSKQKNSFLVFLLLWFARYFYFIVAVKVCQWILPFLLFSPFARDKSKEKVQIMRLV